MKVILFFIVFLACWIGHLKIAVAQGRTWVLNGHAIPQTAENVAQYGFVAHLFKKTIQIHHCGAVLIHPRWVLTAGHCLNPKWGALAPDTVGLGPTDTAGAHLLTFAIEKRVRHPQFQDSDGILDWDFGLIKLAESSPYTPIKMATPGSDVDSSDQPISADVFGWGNTLAVVSPSKILMSGPLPLQKPQVCKDYFKESFRESTMICAGSPQQSVDTCSGDSGGPLVAGDILFGLVGWGDGCSKTSASYGGYSRVSAAYNWIQEVISNDQ